VNDADFVVEDDANLKKAVEVLRTSGWSVAESTGKVAAKQNGKADVEIWTADAMGFGDRVMSAADFEDALRELWGVRLRTVSPSYQNALKQWQAGSRNKENDVFDLAWIGRGCFVGDGVAVSSGFLNGLSTKDAKAKMIAWLEEKKLGEGAVTFRLRDWVFSRQRYWGEPIPIIICKQCGYVPVPEDQLPVLLPDVERYQPSDSGESPLAAIRSWVQVRCPKCGNDAERETDTMPNWAGSSWYFLRYCDSKNDSAFADPEKLKFWMPVDLYDGGMEHTTLHLLYSRFWHKFLWDIGLLPKEIGPEPYNARRSHGLVMAEGGEKMSKSKGNVINPDDIVEQYGADVFRVYEMFMGPYEQSVPWDTNGIEGVRRFLDKVWKLFSGSSLPPITPELETLYHQSVKKVSEDIESLCFNTAVSQLMILTNAFTDAKGVPKDFQEGYLKILAPFAPHMAEELWRGMNKKESIHLSSWPAFDSAKIVSSTFELVIQVNGKVRDRIQVPADISEEDAKAKALASDNVKKFLEGRTPSKIIYVKGRLVTIAG
jgi:leucyl-tRNA synthetase